MAPGRQSRPFEARMALIPQIARLAFAAGGNFVESSVGAERILDILEDSFAPDAVDSVNRAVARFLQFKRAGQTTDVYFVEFDFLRRKAESEMKMGGGFSGALASISRMQNAAL